MLSIRKLLFTVIASAALALPLAANAQDRDPVFIDYGPRGTAPSTLGTGLVMGSIGFAPPIQGVTALSLHFIPLEPGRHKVELFAANRPNHPNWRTPDIDTADARIWAFSGSVPEGKYLIRLAGVTGVDPREILWIELHPSLEVEVKAGEVIYLGRWQFTLPDVQVPEPMIRVPGQPLVLRDTLEEDKAMLHKRGRKLPGKIVDMPGMMMGPRI
ncbi:MAG: hypothetical protein H7255_17045 [Ramlibacter sp.]|nr:hypothetical protein [Ramlibacter sp.]